MTDHPYYLKTAIEEIFSPDPFLSIPDTRTVAAVTGLVVGMADVSKRRRQSLANEPWTSKLSARHIEHAIIHLEDALASIESRDMSKFYDKETRLPNTFHAGLRIAFAHYRRVEEFGE